ncbi:MAG TPA: hypothetical protein VEK57_13335 [Thermoanaerobaculia bacterium]|nr:hypothetical protein [Thermoanaerobaculia bacterium]
MSAERCSREDELLDALGRAFVGAELEAHVGSCSSCTELRMVAGALLDDRAEVMVDAPVPAAGTMWWRMQLRHRRESQALARRSLLVGQAVTLSIAAILVVFLFGADVAAGIRHAVSLVDLSTPMLALLASSIVIAPLVAWIAIREVGGRQSKV